MSREPAGGPLLTRDPPVRGRDMFGSPCGLRTRHRSVNNRKCRPLRSRGYRCRSSRSSWIAEINTPSRDSVALPLEPGFPGRRASRARPDPILLVGGQPGNYDTTASIRLCCVGKILPRFEVPGRIEDKAVNHRDSRLLHWDVMELTTPCRFSSMLDACGVSGISHRQDHQKHQPPRNT